MIARPHPAASPARWGLGLALGGSLLAVSPWQAAAYSLPKLVTLAAGALLAWAALARGGVPRRSTPLDRPLLACAFVLLAGLAFSVDPFLSFIGRYQMYALGVLPLGLCGAVFYAAARAPEEQLTLTKACAAIGLVMGVHAVMQAAGVEPIPFMPDKFPYGRAVGTLGNPAYFGACLTVLFPLALGLALDGGKDRALGWAGVSGLSAGLFASGSRGAFLGAAAGAVVYLALAGRLRAARGRGLWAAAAVLLLAAGFAASLRLRRVADSDSARLAMWTSALSAARHAPWLGTGPDTFEATLRRWRSDDFIRALGPSAGQANAHNDLLQALTTTGVTGLAAYLWLAGALCVLAWRSRGDPRRAAAAGALAGLFLQAKLNPVPLPGMVLAALCAAWLCPSSAPEAQKPRSRSLDGAVALACAAAFLLILRLAAADYSHKKAVVFSGARRPDIALASFARADRLNPGELQYRMIHATVLHRLAASEADPARRLAWLDRAVELGRAAVSWRPNEVDAHQILGTSLVLHRRAGGPDRMAEAETELDRALELDPKFTPLLQNRLVLARERGDAARVKLLSDEIARLEGLRR